MGDVFWLGETEMARLRPFFPKSHGKPRVDDRRVLSGIIYVQRCGLRWKDAPAVYGPYKTLYKRWKRWSDKGIWPHILAVLAQETAPTAHLMLDSTHLKAHRTAASCRKKGEAHAASGGPKAA